jgi:hypothetical protein
MVSAHERSARSRLSPRVPRNLYPAILFNVGSRGCELVTAGDADDVSSSHQMGIAAGRRGYDSPAGSLLPYRGEPLEGSRCRSVPALALPLRDSRSARCRRDGRRVSRARSAAGPRRRDQGAAGPLRGRYGADHTLPARGADARGPQSSTHRRDLRTRRGRRVAIPDPGTRRRGHAGRTAEGWTTPCRRGSRDCTAGGGCVARRARQGDHPPRSEAGQHRADPERRRESARLRARQSARAGAAGRHLQFADDHLSGDKSRRDSGHCRLHEPGAGARAAARQAHRHLGLRLRALRDVDRAVHVPGGNGLRHDREGAGT